MKIPRTIRLTLLGALLAGCGVPPEGAAPTGAPEAHIPADPGRAAPSAPEAPPPAVAPVGQLPALAYAIQADPGPGADAGEPAPLEAPDAGEPAAGDGGDGGEDAGAPYEGPPPAHKVCEKACPDAGKDAGP